MTDPLHRSEKASLLRNAFDDDHDSDAASTSVFVSPHKVKTGFELQERDRSGGGASSGSWGGDANLIEMEVPEGASLASIALKYNMPVAELKRVNNIINDSELYALKRIKIPVKPNSVLTEILIPGLDDDGGGGEASRRPPGGDANGWMVEHFSTPPLATGSEVSSPVLSDASDMSFSAMQAHAGASPKRSTPGSDSRQTKKAKRLLRAMDKDLANIREKSERLLNDSSLSGEPGDLDLDMSGAAGVDSRSGMYYVSKWACITVSVVLLVVIVIILAFARHEFQVIEHEMPPEELLHGHKEEHQQHVVNATAAGASN